MGTCFVYMWQSICVRYSGELHLDGVSMTYRWIVGIPWFGPI